MKNSSRGSDANPFFSKDPDPVFLEIGFVTLKKRLARNWCLKFDPGPER